MSSIDIVIPCYNYGHFLRSCVDSVLSQSGVNVRVLIIDDASSDATVEICQELAATDRRIEFRSHDVNRGHIATYNEGLIGWSTAEYTVLLSADDLLAPGCLGRAARIMDADESIGMVYGRAVDFHRDEDLQGVRVRESGYSRFSGTDWLEGRCRTGRNVISSPEVVVRGRVQRAVGGYRAELPHTGDLEMWLRIAAVSGIAYVRGAPQAFYRVHPASMLRTNYSNSFLDLQHRKAAFDSFFQQHRHSDAARLKNLVNRAFAREALWDACRAYDHNRVEDSRVAELVEFAAATYSEVASLSEYAALCRRRRLGPVLCHRTQLFVGTAVVRRVSHWLGRQRWKRRGV